MHIRKANRQDLKSCAAISHVPELADYFQASDDYIITCLQEFLDKGIFFVAEEDKILGYMIAEMMQAETLWLEGAVVISSQRGKGIGKALLSAVQEEGRRGGAKRLILMAPDDNPSTIKFYEKAGLAKGKRYIEFSETL